MAGRGASALLILFGTLLPAAMPVNAGTDLDGMKPCQQLPNVRGKARQVYKLQDFVILTAMLEEQGEAHFRPQFTAPQSECLRERFTAGAANVSAVYSPWEKDEQTVHYRFLSGTGDEQREVLVLYNGLASIMSN